MLTVVDKNLRSSGMNLAYVQYHKIIDNESNKEENSNSMQMNFNTDASLPVKLNKTENNNPKINAQRMKSIMAYQLNLVTEGEENELDLENQDTVKDLEKGDILIEEVNSGQNEELDYEIDHKVIFETEIGEKMKKWVDLDSNNMIHNVW